MENSTLVFGFPDEWKKLESTHPKFFQSFSNLQDCVETAFRGPDCPELADHHVFLLGLLCVEDFKEALILCINGYGSGAFKIVRGMFERVVTAHYIHKHPEKAELSQNFHWIQQHKLVSAVRKTLGEAALSAKIIKEIEVVETNYQKVKGHYQVTDCEKCGTTKTNYTWSKLDIISMAKEVGLGEQIVPCYYQTLKHVHSDVFAASNRVQKSGDDRNFVFNFGPQPDIASRALRRVHSLLLKALSLQIEHFKLSLMDEKFNVCVRNFDETWNKQKEND